MDNKDKPQESKLPANSGEEQHEEIPKMDSHKKNPNPRANENLPADVQEEQKDPANQQGPGSEITDGEDG